MSRITTAVDRAIPTLSRFQTFTESGIAAGDILMIHDSLGRAANQLSVSDVSGGDLYLEFNVLQEIHPPRTDFIWMPGTAKDLSVGGVLEVSGVPSMEILSGETLDLDNEFAIDTIRIGVATTATAFKLFVS